MNFSQVVALSDVFFAGELCSDAARGVLGIVFGHFGRYF